MWMILYRLNVRTPRIYASLPKKYQKFSLCHTSLNKSNVENGNSIDSNDEELSAIKHVFDLRDPGQFFLQARMMKRHFVFHAGPTNSGKTYYAMEAFLHASNGIYCGPLRMLASEVYRKTNARDVPCDMITGEERLWAVSRDEPSSHVACTVELCTTTTNYDVAIIDEVQMLRCDERGWAWTRALLGLPAKEIHLCGEASAINIVKKLLSKTNDTLEIKVYERLTPLYILNKSGGGGIHMLKTGDCVVAFSQKDIYLLRTKIEKSGLKSAVIYGNLPSNIRFEQAEKFNNGECDVLVASDAIGMGLNLNIKRIIFSALRKFDGHTVKDLTPHHIKQIAGRAGRYKSKYEIGSVTSLEGHLLPKLRRLMQTPIKEIGKAGILPSFAQLELLSLNLPGKNLLELLEVFEMLIELDKNYFLCDLERMKMVCREIHDIPLTLKESYCFAIAPMSIINKPFICQAMKQFASSVYTKKNVTETSLKKLVRWPPKANPHRLEQLKHFEYIHEIFDLYRWLHYRFEEIFVDVEKVIVLQEELETIIGTAIDRNLKNYKVQIHKKMHWGSNFRM